MLDYADDQYDDVDDIDDEDNNNNTSGLIDDDKLNTFIHF
jgi:hypothetical protein